MKDTCFKIVFLLSMVFLASCGPTPYYENSVVVNAEDWKHDEKVDFEIDTVDTETKYNMNLVVNHSPNFSYQNLYLNIITTFPSKEPTEERLNIELSDQKGRWVGKCSGELCKVKVYLLDDFKFPEKGKYTFSIEQLSREESLKGISELKFEIYETEATK